MIDREDEIVRGDLTLSSDQTVVSHNVRMVTNTLRDAWSWNISVSSTHVKFFCHKDKRTKGAKLTGIKIEYNLNPRSSAGNCSCKLRPSFNRVFNFCNLLDPSGLYSFRKNGDT